MTGRVIVLGGGGFIARHFVDEYRRRNTRVVIVDTRTPAFPLAGESFVMGDVRDPSTFEGLLEPGDSVLHLAAAHHDFGLTRETFFSVNAWGAEVLAQAMQRAGVVDCCFFSSVAVYGHGEGTHAEGDPCRPWSHYGASKLAAEQSLEEWACAAPDRRLLIVRPTMTFGEYNFANMYSLISQLHSGRYALVGQGRNRKSIAYVGNLVDAALQLWGAPRERVSVVNYADKPDLSSREIETLVAGALGRRMPPVKVPYPVARIMVTPFDAYTRLTGRDLGLSSDRVRKFARDETVYDCEKVFATGFRPRYSLAEGIERTVRWFLEEGRHLAREARRPAPRPDDARLASRWLAGQPVMTSAGAGE